MATASKSILSIDKNTKRVQFTDGKWVSFPNLSKVELIKVGSFLQVKWNGTPMHKSLTEIRNIVDVALVGVTTTMQPTVEKQIIRTTEPVVPAKAVTPTGSSLDAVIATMVANIMQTIPVGIDEDKVRDIVSDVIDPMALATSVAMDRLNTKIEALQPKVTQIIVKDRPAITLKGVQHKAFGDIMMSISARCNTFLVGPAGTGKTTMVSQVAEALNLGFHAENLTAATTEYALKGFKDANSNYVPTKLREFFQNGGVYLLDEIDNANPNVLGVLNSALSNGFMAFPDGMVSKHPDFIAVAAGNTYGNGATAEYVGRNPIDGATLDRFAFFNVDIDESVEDAMLAGFGLPSATASTWLKAVRQSRQNVATSGLRVIVSPRATANGAGLLAQGMDMDKVYNATVLKGAKQDQVEKIRQGVTLSVSA
ncbi:ATPase-like protein [uncultured Caudovirales phage]|uniref:ATPase-like protein n=1 Tax=uncultured Caudovirales phage TaxID=2100421 RepID=A0A6J5LNK0_9CAUD|nr:ATPase-like protein [uncultured Caudovirales phage]